MLPTSMEKVYAVFLIIGIVLVLPIAFIGWLIHIARDIKNG